MQESVRQSPTARTVNVNREHTAISSRPCQFLDLPPSVYLFIKEPLHPFRLVRAQEFDIAILGWVEGVRAEQSHCRKGHDLATLVVNHLWGRIWFTPLLHRVTPYVTYVHTVCSLRSHPPNKLRGILEEIPQNRPFSHTNPSTTPATLLHTCNWLAQPRSTK